MLSDNGESASRAVRHLADHGHRHIAYLGDWLEIATARQRFQGYQEACIDLGLRPRPHHVVHDLRSSESASAAVTALLRAGDAPTALFTSQNLVTIGAVRALQELGLHEGVAVVGFDDFPLADLVQPRATVVAQDLAAIGRTAASSRADPRGSGEIPSANPSA